MKKKFHLGGIAALTLLGSFATSQAQTATTTPVGYTTETLQQGFNLIGLTLHQPTIASGAFESVSASSVTDTDITFTDASVLNTSGSATYILEITSGALAGSIQDITAWSANALTTPDDLLAAGLLAGDTYSIRKASTIADVFGADNSAGLQGNDSFSSTNADVLLIPDESGTFEPYFYSTNAARLGWLNSSFQVANDTPIIYTDGIYVQRRSATPLELVVTGSVKMTATAIPIEENTFNVIGSVYPAGVTLESSGLSSTLQGNDSFSSSNADVVLIPNGSGGFDQFFYSTNSARLGWLDSAFQVSNDTALKSGSIIRRRGTATVVSIQPPQQ